MSQATQQAATVARPRTRRRPVEATSGTLSLSVLVPVYNEQYLVEASLRRLLELADTPLLGRIEIIVVDDGSLDDTGLVLARLADELPAQSPPHVRWLFLRNAQNRGKGAALQAALQRATGDITVCHDADLEYQPRDLVSCLPLFLQEDADAVFGSRFAGSPARPAAAAGSAWMRRALTRCCNLVGRLNLTDVETCYKLVRTDLLKSIPLTSHDFRIEVELTLKLARRGARIFEVPVAYAGRSRREGKKLAWRDGLRAFSAVASNAVTADIFVPDEHLSQTLSRLDHAPRFNAWMADTLRPFLGQQVLEVGAGVGNLTKRLIPRSRYVATDINPHCLRRLKDLARNLPYVEAVYCDITDSITFPREAGGFDTVLCVSLLERLDDDVAALRNLRDVLAPDGRIVLVVPHGPWNLGTLDQALGHHRRYTRQSLEALAREAGLEVRQIHPFNRVGTAPWWINGRLLRRRAFDPAPVLALNALTPVLRRVDGLLPLPGLSLVAVLTHPPVTTALDAGPGGAP